MMLKPQGRTPRMTSGKQPSCKATLFKEGKPENVLTNKYQKDIYRKNLT
jgi:hypothetical protein